MAPKKKTLAELVHAGTFEARRLGHCNLLVHGPLLETPALRTLQEAYRESDDALERQQIARTLEREVRAGAGAGEGETTSTRLGFMELSWAQSGPMPGWIDPAPMSFGELQDAWADWNREHGTAWRILHGCPTRADLQSLAGARHRKRRPRKPRWKKKWGDQSTTGPNRSGTDWDAYLEAQRDQHAGEALGQVNATRKAMGLPPRPDDDLLARAAELLAERRRVLEGQEPPPDPPGWGLLAALATRW